MARTKCEMQAPQKEINTMKRVAALALIFLGFVLGNDFSYAQHFSEPKGTPYWVDFVGTRFLVFGEPASVGDEIGVFTEAGILCGSFTVKNEGQYGSLHVYGDDPTTEEIEGALPNDRLIFKVWKEEQRIEIEVSDGQMEPCSIGSVRQPELPIVWTQARDRFGLNIDIKR